MTLTEQLKEEKRKLFGITYVPKQEKAIGEVPDIMKKYITGKLSIIDVVSYLEPFLIYPDDLTFKQYKDITEFIDEKISNYNKNVI